MRVEELLHDDSGPDPVAVARVLAGRDRLRVRWRREIVASPGGVGVVVASNGAPRIAVCEPGRVIGVGPDGGLKGRFTVPPEAGVVTHGDFDGNGRPELVGFRPGGDRLVIIDAAAGRHRLVEAPATVMDMAVVPAQSDGEGDRLALATLEGLYVGAVDGDPPILVGAAGRRTGAAAPGEGGVVVALDEDRNLEWYGPDGNTTATTRGPTDGWTLIADRRTDGAGVLPPDTVATATGSILGPEDRAVAVAGPSGQLVVVEIATGRAVFRARWPGVTALAAWDLDGDGVDELLVASDGALTVLEALPSD
jgi:hypothetical protein